MGQCTINMPRIAYLSRNEEEFYQRLDHMMDISARSLHVKREVVENFLMKDYIPIQRDIWEILTAISPLSVW